MSEETKSDGTRYLVQVSLGPVQDFIASARRCRDLWFGSWLLSELSKAAAQSIAQTNDVEMIFPPRGSDLSPDSNLAVANKIVAVVKDDPAAVARYAEAAARERLWQLAQNTFDRLESRGARLWRDEKGHGEKGRVADRQIEDLLEWNWAAARLDGENGFAAARRRSERLLAARKACRDFDAVDWGSAAPKSSLDGAREAVIDEGEYRLGAENLYEKYGVRPGERLCGVGLLKRQGERGHGESRIASTSHVAAQSLLARWNELHDTGDKKKAAQAEIDIFVEELRQLGLPESALDSAPDFDPIFGHHDGHLLFPNRLAEFFDDAAKARDAQKHLATLLKKLDPQSARAPQPYYAVLLADGDKMGASISRADSIERNQDLLWQLGAFAREVRGIVESKKNRGTLIYAGGDDVLALLPLHTALPCARELAVKFAEKFKGLDWLETKPTLSAGLAIVHHLEPLSEALELARGAEKAAKSVAGKNALAVTLAKRSGGDVTVKDHWGDGGNEGLDGRLQRFAGWTGQLATGLAFEWRDLALRVKAEKLAHEDEAAFDARRDKVFAIWQSEAVRLLERKRESGGEEQVKERLKQELTAIVDAALSRENLKDAKERGDWLSPLASELIVAREFAAAQSLADPKTEART